VFLCSGISQRSSLVSRTSDACFVAWKDELARIELMEEGLTARYLIVLTVKPCAIRTPPYSCKIIVSGEINRRSVETDP